MCRERPRPLHRATDTAIPIAFIAAYLFLLPGAARGEVSQRLRLGLSTEVRYDSEAMPGGDVAGKLLPRLGYARTSPRSALVLDYGVDLTRHLNAPGLSLDHRGELSWRFQATRRLELRAEGAIYRVEESTSLPRFGVAYSEAGALWSFVELHARHRLTRAARLEVSARSEWNQLIAPQGGRETPLSGMQVLQVSQRYPVTRLIELGWGVRGQLFSAGQESLGSSGAILVVS